ncbi:MAG: hypothetical protein JJLCMIEE_03338 [Acidimicrobiales bacterium]|nr:hypothetical protein [Acidimicrobiales bacterium]
MSRDRPLTARSVIASTLLGSEPPRLPSRRLVQAGALFGLAEGTVRVALSRMVKAGELHNVDGSYELAGDLVSRQRRQRESLLGERRPWRGSWRLAVVVAEARSAGERLDLRRAMRTLRLAERREGVWARPDNLDPRRFGAERAVIDSQCEWYEAEVADDAALAGALWDLDGWAREAQALRERMDGLIGRLEDDDRRALAPGFVLAAGVLRHVQADPLLPSDLEPAGWPGSELRLDYDRYDGAFRSVLRGWFLEWE